MKLPHNSRYYQSNILPNCFSFGKSKHWIETILSLLDCTWFVDHRDENNTCVIGENIEFIFFICDFMDSKLLEDLFTRLFLLFCVFTVNCVL